MPAQLIEDEKAVLRGTSFQPLCIGGFYCGVIFIPCLAGVFVPPLAGIALMFGIGITAGFMPALILCIRMLKQENIRIDFASPLLQAVTRATFISLGFRILVLLAVAPIERQGQSGGFRLRHCPGFA